ncbi:uncharacterized protein LAESUDRAFT_182627 [Laetiporus sulphureus 93-53]|uniref:Secreted protein n=1 Tax=Laetiporus sulphureus 93-53 TaxID=1314785 RepID=A0A165E9N8_9APHY|nr:uncharacterized protein LAESUDRAFT_182627 [Laetiporus sulphureus 93-53]KZT06540.1 hypothetical protein LAESUDRAFT_182627 [Laetiporus sulphureus 93-53]
MYFIRLHVAFFHLLQSFLRSPSANALQKVEDEELLCHLPSVNATNGPSGSSSACASVSQDEAVGMRPMHPTGKAYGNPKTERLSIRADRPGVDVILRRWVQWSELCRRSSVREIILPLPSLVDARRGQTTRSDWASIFGPPVSVIRIQRTRRIVDHGFTAARTDDVCG